MSYKITSIYGFEKEVKRLSKKYPSLKNELKTLVEEMRDNPFLGTPIGKNCFKIRMAIASKGKGKSGGARIITHIHIHASTIFLISIYDTSEQSDITDSELDNRLKSI